MFSIIRKYASVVLVSWMCLFGLALALDEYNDACHIMENIRIESCVELETEDYEWDEAGGNCITASNIAQPLLLMERVFTLREIRERGFISDKQKIGLLRLYVPRKTSASHNYTLT